MKPYIANSLPLENLDYKRLFKLVGDANAALARYDGLLQGIINPEILLSPLTTQEAVLSSKIEGTQATLDEVLEYDAGIAMDIEKTQDIQEITNYRKALMLSKDLMPERPITLPLIREMHKILMNSVRGKDKNPGEFRKDQNWIGRPRCLMEEATFVPVSPFELINNLEQWAQYAKGDDMDAIMQLSIIHAQFELIHPFKDGNGRLGRLLIPLFLYQKKKLASPMFYLSSYLEKNREHYYDSLKRISADNDWNQWIEFFLNAVKLQAIENSKKVHSIMALYDKMKHSITEVTHSQFSIRILDELFSNPIFRTTDFITKTGINKQTALSLIQKIKEAGHLTLLKEASGRRPAVFMFKELLNITEGKDML
jgi:Fic family protein